MTFKICDKGQRYEVRYKDDEGIERVMGWADESENLVKAIELHPSYHSPRVIDRQAKALSGKKHGGCRPDKE